MPESPLTCFNKTLLAKQCWRLLQNTDSLSAQILRAKYYPKGSILDAQLGSKPSYALRSIQGAKELLADGLMWRIEDGATTGIYGEKWVPIPTTFMVQSQPRSLQETVRVMVLISTDTKCWVETILQDNFNPEEVQAILTVLFSGAGHLDMRVWHGTDSRVFSIRSAYHLAKEKESYNCPEGSKRVGDRELWGVIRQLQLPNVDKNFMWRACNNILPMRENLQRGKVVTDPLCPIGGLEVETATHILWACPSTFNVWSSREWVF